MLNVFNHWPMNTFTGIVLWPSVYLYCSNTTGQDAIVPRHSTKPQQREDLQGNSNVVHSKLCITGNGKPHYDFQYRHIIDVVGKELQSCLSFNLDIQV